MAATPESSVVSIFPRSSTQCTDSRLGYRRGGSSRFASEVGFGALATSQAPWQERRLRGVGAALQEHQRGVPFHPQPGPWGGGVPQRGGLRLLLRVVQRRRVRERRGHSLLQVLLRNVRMQTLALSPSHRRRASLRWRSLARGAWASRLGLLFRQRSSPCAVARLSCCSRFRQSPSACGVSCDRALHLVRSAKQVCERWCESVSACSARVYRHYARDAALCDWASVWRCVRIDRRLVAGVRPRIKMQVYRYVIRDNVVVILDYEHFVPAWCTHEYVNFASRMWWSL